MQRRAPDGGQTGRRSNPEKPVLHGIRQKSTHEQQKSARNCRRRGGCRQGECYGRWWSPGPVPRPPTPDLPPTYLPPRHQLTALPTKILPLLSASSFLWLRTLSNTADSRQDPLFLGASVTARAPPAYQAAYLPPPNAPACSAGSQVEGPEYASRRDGHARYQAAYPRPPTAPSRLPPPAVRRAAASKVLPATPSPEGSPGNRERKEPDGRVRKAQSARQPGKHPEIRRGKGPEKRNRPTLRGSALPAETRRGLPPTRRGGPGRRLLLRTRRPARSAPHGPGGRWASGRVPGNPGGMYGIHEQQGGARG